VVRIPEAIYLMQIFVSAFLTILFLQSGIDKIVDRRGNFGWLRGHFAKSPLAGIVPALLICITILEVGAGARLGEAITPSVYHVAICSAFKEPFQRGLGK